MSQNHDRCRPTAVDDHDDNRCTDRESIQLKNSLVYLEESRTGHIATVRRPGEDWHEWAGPLDAATVDALREVAANV